MRALHLVRLAIGAAALAFGAASAQTVSTMVVPFPAGGPSDFLARTLQPNMQRLLGQTLIVENVGGASGALGVQRTLGAPGTGGTMLLASPMELILAPLTLKAVNHKPEDLRPAAIVVRTTLVLGARKDLPANTLAELLEAQRKPGAAELTYGSAGPGSLYHLAGDSFSRQAGLRMTHVPYKGTAPMVQDLLGGQIDVAFLPLAGSIPAMIKDGRIKAYGVTAKQPYPLYDSLLPIATQTGFDALEFDIWAGIFVPRQVPDAAVEKLTAAIAQSLTDPAVRQALESTGNILFDPMKPAEYDAFYAREIARYQALAKAIGVQPE